MFAAAKKLDNLVAFVDFNNLQIDGSVDEVNSPKPIDKKFEAFGWNVICIDGNNFGEIEKALAEAREFKGKGVSFMENQVSWHGVAPNDEQYEAAMAELNAKIAELN